MSTEVTSSCQVPARPPGASLSACGEGGFTGQQPRPGNKVWGHRKRLPPGGWKQGSPQCRTQCTSPPVSHRDPRLFRMTETSALEPMGKVPSLMTRDNHTVRSPISLVWRPLCTPQRRQEAPATATLPLKLTHMTHCLPAYCAFKPDVADGRLCAGNCLAHCIANTEMLSVPHKIRIPSFYRKIRAAVTNGNIVTMDSAPGKTPCRVGASLSHSTTPPPPARLPGSSPL